MDTVDADGQYGGGRDDAAVAADLHIRRVQPDEGPVALQRPVQKGLHALIDVLAQAADLALRDAGHAHGLDQVVDGTRRDARHVGLLDHRDQRLLRRAPRLQEGREVGALAQLGDAQIDGAGPRLPGPLAVAVALGQPLVTAFAVAGTGQRLDLQLHQALGGKADHLAQEVGVGALPNQLLKSDPVLGHRVTPSRLMVVKQPQLSRRTR